MQRIMSERTIPRLCVLFPGALGDLICFLPALQILARDAAVDLFARTEFAGIVPASVRVRSLERYEISRLFAPNAVADERVGNFFCSYVAIHSWMGSRNSEFVRQLRSVTQGRSRIYPFHPTGMAMHQTDFFLSCLTEMLPVSCDPSIVPHPDALAWSERYWAQQSLRGRAVLVLAPGSGAREKNWPQTFYRTVADWWPGSTGGAVIVLHGPVEEARGEMNLLQDDTVIARDLTLAQVAALIYRSDVYLGNDSGITHLAAAVGIRTVALFGPSDARRWAPRGKQVTIVSRQVQCSPCAPAVMKACPHRACLTGLSPAQVIDELSRLPAPATLTRGGVRITV
jgi:ADP-heptose:LPS heptosyltransferase